MRSSKIVQISVRGFLLLSLTFSMIACDALTPSFAKDLNNPVDPEVKKKTETEDETISEIEIGSTGQAGGLVFYDKGSISDGWRYLEAAPSDQDTNVPWNTGFSGVIQTSTLIGTGKANTTAIVTATGVGYYAAKLCDDLILAGYDDWFLPSKAELDAMYNELKLQGLGNFANYGYWSSSQVDGQSAWCKLFTNGGWQNYMFVTPTTENVRAIRSFAGN